MTENAANPFLDAAILYAEHGWAVLPLAPSEKTPLTSHGFKDATTDAAAIREWWAKWPGANVGIATGALSGLVVLDVDPRNNGDVSLLDLPHTIQGLTGGGGAHYLFAHPGGIVPCSTGVLGPGLDIKADGGYVVAPPSVHPNGKAYAWEGSSGPEDVRLAAMPDFMRTVEPPQDAKPPLDVASILDGIPEGQRNEKLFQYACSLWGRGTQRDEAEAIILLGEAMRKAKPPYTDEAARSLFARVKKRYADGDHEEGAETEETFARRLTPFENAGRLHCHSGCLAYVDSSNRWFLWDGPRWKPDDVRKSELLTNALYRIINTEAEKEMDTDRQRRLRKWAIRSLEPGMVDATLKKLRSMPWVAKTVEDFDRHPLLVNFRNGIVNVETASFSPHAANPEHRDLFISKVIPFDYREDAKCPVWLGHLDKVFSGKPDLIAFFQRAIGYTLTGLTTERVFFLLHGSGQNGKSVIVRTIRNLLGDYALTIAKDTLMEQRGGTRWELADLPGIRFVSAVEGKGGDEFDPSVIKSLTGGDEISAQRKHGHPFRFFPQFKAFIATNKLPQIDADDQAMWDRARRIPFDVRITDTEKDLDFDAKLAGEMEGIAAWAVQGAISWRREGLGAPLEVTEATETYRETMRKEEAFLAEMCEPASGAQEEVGKLFAVFEQWCAVKCYEPGTVSKFSRGVGKKYEKGRAPEGRRSVVFGLRLNQEGRAVLEKAECALPF